MRMVLLLLSALAGCGAVYVRPQLMRHEVIVNRGRCKSPVALDPGMPTPDTSAILDTLKEGMNVARPVVGEGVRATVQGLKAAAPIVQQGIELGRQGIDVAAPLVKQGIDASIPAVKQGVDAAAPVIKQGVEAAAPVVGGVVSETVRGAGSLARTLLSPEQQQQLDEAARVGSQVGEVAGSVTQAAASTVLKAAPVVRDGLEKGLPVAGKVVETVASGAGQTLRTAAEKAEPVVKPVLKDLLDEGQITSQTLQTIESYKSSAWLDFNAGGNAFLRNLASGLRDVAGILDDEPASTTVRQQTARPFQVPTVKEVTDDFASSLVRAGAPYLVGGGVLLVALEALRQLVEPLEKIVKQVLAVLVLTAIARVAYVNWDTIYSTYEILSGAKPLIKF